MVTWLTTEHGYLNLDQAASVLPIKNHGVLITMANGAQFKCGSTVLARLQAIDPSIIEFPDPMATVDAHTQVGTGPVI